MHQLCKEEELEPEFPGQATTSECRVCRVCCRASLQPGEGCALVVTSRRPPCHWRAAAPPQLKVADVNAPRGYIKLAGKTAWLQKCDCNSPSVSACVTSVCTSPLLKSHVPQPTRKEALNHPPGHRQVLRQRPRRQERSLQQDVVEERLSGGEAEVGPWRQIDVLCAKPCGIQHRRLAGNGPSPHLKNPSNKYTIRSCLKSSLNQFMINQNGRCYTVKHKHPLDKIVSFLPPPPKL